MKSHRAGVVLLEVLCALVLLTSGGVALVRVTAACMHGIAQAQATESVIQHQARLLTAHSLMTGEELAARAGLRSLGDLTVEVTPMSSRLFRVTVSSRQVPALTSVLYAAE